MRDLPLTFREKCLLRYNLPFNFKENYLQMVKMPLPREEFASKSKRQIPHTKITKFLPFQCLQVPLNINSAQCSKGRTYKKIDVQLFEFNDIFCILNEILHQKQCIIEDLMASKLDFLKTLSSKFMLKRAKHT